MTAASEVERREYLARCSTTSNPDCHGAVTVVTRSLDAAGEILAAWGWGGHRVRRTCPACLCAPTEAPMAYYGQRAVTRNTTEGEPLHAVGLWSVVGGAMDAECGVIGAIAAGPWDPDNPANCKKCAKFVAGLAPLRDLPAPALTAPATPAPSDEPVELLPPFPYFIAA